MAVQYRYLYPALGDRDTFFVVAHHFAESVSELVTLSLRDLAADGSAAEREMIHARRIRDRAYSVAAGPCGSAEAVLFSDHEDAEAPDSDDDPDRVRGDVEDFNGLHVRRLSDGALVERIPRALPDPIGAPLVGTASVIAAVLSDRVEIVPRVPGVVRATILGRALSLDTEDVRIAAVDADGELDLLELPR